MTQKQIKLFINKFFLSFSGQLPKRIFLGFVSAKAFNSNILLNGFNFQHFNHSHVNLTLDSNIQIRAIKSDFDKDFYLNAYLSLFTSSGIHFSDSGNNISRSEYPKGYALLGFDLTEDLSASENHLSLPRQGTLRVDLKFDKPLPEGICVILYSEFDSIIEISKNREIMIDYSS